LASISGGSLRSLSKGPPGAMRIMKKAIVMISSRVGTAPIRRLIA
jgi:hypothetical protein